MYALWTDAALDEAEDAHSVELDRILAALTADEIDHAEFCRLADANDRRRGQQRTRITKRAYGLRFAGFEAAVG